MKWEHVQGASLYVLIDRYCVSWWKDLVTALVPLLCLRASRNSPAFPGSMLSWSRRASSPQPGRHSGRSPEWLADALTDIRTVLHPAAEASSPGTEEQKEEEEEELEEKEEEEQGGPGSDCGAPELCDIPPSPSITSHSTAASLSTTLYFVVVT